VASYGRGELTRYAESLLEAVKVWREAGAWRSKHEAIAPKKSTKPAPLKAPSTALNSPEARNVISFIERVAERRRSGLPSELERPRNEWRRQSLPHESAPVVSPKVFFQQRADLLHLALALFRDVQVGSSRTHSVEQQTERIKFERTANNSSGALHYLARD
jgi:hypothetical protein